ncbi:MAG: Ig-like domain-containing protein [Flavobacteriales bacterium]
MIPRWPWIAALLLAACAQVREPTGGDPDKTGPTLVESTPPLGSTGFAGDRIVLRFNERVQLKNIREHLVVSPPLATAPTVRLIGDRSVQIGLEAPLLPNTTYVFDYAKGVVDLTESNAAPDLPFVISTGSAIDSAALRVEVFEARTAQPSDVVEVLVFAEADTCDPRNCLPVYFARTDEHGHALVRYMRPGRYRAFALRDKNGNHRYDLPNESIAVADSVVEAGMDTAARVVALQLFTARDTLQRLLDARLVDGALRIALSRAAKTVELAPTDGQDVLGTWIPEWNAGADTVRLWYTGADSLARRTFLVRVDGVPMDTALAEQRKPLPSLGIARAPLSGKGGWEVQTTRVIGFIDSTRMQLLKDSVAVPFSLTASLSHPRRFQLTSPLKPGDKAVLTLLPGALADHQRRTHDTLTLELVIPGEKEVGNLNVTLHTLTNGYNGPYILELLDPNGSVALTTMGSALPDSVQWQALPPKTYGLRMIEDENGNGRWDTGSPREALPPERVYRHPAGATVRVGWDVEVAW